MTTAIKPIRPTHLEFETEAEMQNFISYATSKKKTADPGLDRLRKLMKTHKRAPERK
ncbi:hypothetical protein PAESOLCIP111_03996 [Paenibacillus solanacearum]|uniref:Uncharacterized protein n=1 Tax=Paenibacillus solanacearum TaxID=2048548 RepID=A0A916NQN1_9BACL|nr:hypothetical protein [Paenibacillus solanacearum]CAG7638972.1 hypothetical protein PAESOLCIP111_03996 [Paenibacillus solanacearum]